jgi:hypothetical protein
MERELTRGEYHVFSFLLNHATQPYGVTEIHEGVKDFVSWMEVSNIVEDAAGAGLLDRDIARCIDAQPEFRTRDKTVAYLLKLCATYGENLRRDKNYNDVT